jgi:hypothetical protein
MAKNTAMGDEAVWIWRGLLHQIMRGILARIFADVPTVLPRA